MTISMSELICVTSRALCRGDFLSRIEAIAKASPAAILLREKELPEPAYRKLAKEVMALCSRYHVPCILHNFPETALALGAPHLHLPLPLLRELSAGQKARFSSLGASCHSVTDAVEAEALGCTYLIAGHIFPTDCKKGLSPRGLPFLAEVCAAVSIPVYAIGGIARGNIAAVRSAGAAGGCVMSGPMCCPDVVRYLKEFERSDESDQLF